MVTGCLMPPYVANLDEILEQEGINNRVRYGYRCTAGAHRGGGEAGAQAGLQHQEDQQGGLQGDTQEDRP